MPFLVSDTSVIIDLDRGDLLDAAFQLGDQLVVPDLLFSRELDADFGARLRSLGLVIESLDAGEVTRATRLGRTERRLSVADTFAFALAHGRRWTLLTGDGTLRSVAEAQGIAVHGVLWIIDRIEAAGLHNAPTLHACLSKTSAHPRCRLPKREVELRLKRYIAEL
jgi:predicted nucleic acid-binding protein